MFGIKPFSRGCAVVAATLGLTVPAQAEFKLRYPNIDYREIEIENNASYTFDKRQNGNTPTPISVGKLRSWLLPFWRLSKV